LFGQGIIGNVSVTFYFYSGFVVTEKLVIHSNLTRRISAEDGGHVLSTEDDESLAWESDGAGKHNILPLLLNMRQDRGTSVVLHLKPDLIHYLDTRALFYVPSLHQEEYGMRHMEPGLSLY
jgi:HSP90 family molecular chaperone